MNVTIRFFGTEVLHVSTDPTSDAPNGAPDALSNRVGFAPPHPHWQPAPIPSVQ